MPRWDILGPPGLHPPQNLSYWPPPWLHTESLFQRRSTMGEFSPSFHFEIKKVWYFFSTEDYILSCDSKYPPSSGPVTGRSAVFSGDRKYCRYRVAIINYQTQMQFDVCRAPSHPPLCPHILMCYDMTLEQIFLWQLTNLFICFQFILITKQHYML